MTTPALLSTDTAYSGIVAYTDGSCRAMPPSTNAVPGAIGWGMHCYVYNDVKPTKGSGHPKIHPTSVGYAPKDEAKDKAITVMQYATLAGSRKDIGTNNTAEILAINSAFEYAKKYRIKDLLIKSDSKIAMGGINNGEQHVRYGWKNQDGTMVSNYAELQRTYKNYTDLKNNGVNITMQWIKGHSTHFGNLLVDKVAGISSHKSVAGIEGETLQENHPDGYWKNKDDKHPLLCYRGMFFNTHNNRCKPGEYYLGNMVKSDEFIGQRDTDGALGYVQLEKPDEILELVRDRQIEISTDLSTLVLCRIDRVYVDTRAEDLRVHGKYALVRGKHEHAHMYFVDSVKNLKEPVTEELYPPKLAMRVVTGISEMMTLLEAFKKNRNDMGEKIEIFDVTDNFYKVVDVKHNKEFIPKQELKAEIGQTDKEVTIPLKLFGIDHTVREVFGIHLPPRNFLKKLNHTDVEVFILAVKETDYAVRYHTVIHTNGDWSIWSGYYSNLLVRSEKQLKEAGILPA